VSRKRVRLVLGTHDVELIDRIAKYADAIGMDRHELEVAMLYGIRTDQQLRLAAEGYRVESAHRVRRRVVRVVSAPTGRAAGQRVVASRARCSANAGWG